MAITNKIKKKSNKHRLTHRQHIQKYSGVSKKYKTLVNNNKTQRMINRIRTARRAEQIGATRLSTYKLQNGGFLGLDYIALKWKLHKFENIIKKLNAFDKSMEKDIESYRIQSKEFEERAKEKADLQTQYITQYRAKVIYEIYKIDEAEAPKNKEATKIAVEDSLITINNHITTIAGRIGQLDKEIGKDYPEFSRLMESFEGKAEKFREITKKYSENSKFYQEVKELKRSYDLTIGAKDQSGIGGRHKSKVKKFEKNKDIYMKILELTDANIEERRKKEQEVADLLRTTEYYKDQFGSYRGKKKITLGKLDKDMIGIKCSATTGLLCDWVANYRKLAEDIFVIAKMCADIIKKMGDIKKSAEICVKNLNTVFPEGFKKDPQAQAMIRFENQMIYLIDMFGKAGKEIGLLKAEFYKQTPAARIMIDYNELTVEFNYLHERLKSYKEVFSPEKSMPKEVQKGGSHVPKNNICNSLKRFQLNNTFYKDTKHYTITKIQENYKNLYNMLKNANNKECYDDPNEFKDKIFYAYENFWLFMVNTSFNLNKIDNTIDPDVINGLKKFIEIKYYLNNSTTYKWNKNLKEYIAKIFQSQFKHYEIHRDFLNTNVNFTTFEIIFTDISQIKQNIMAIRMSSNFEHVKDIVYRVIKNSHSPKTTDSNFFGVLEWDDNVGPSNPNTPDSTYTGIKHHLSAFIKNLKSNVDKSTYYDPTNPMSAPTTPTTSATTISIPGTGGFDIDANITTVEEYLNKLDINHSFAWQDEYTDFLKQIQRALKSQKKEKGTIIIEAANQKDIEKVINELKNKIDGYDSLNSHEIKYYKSAIGKYTGLDLQPLLNIYDEVISRSYTPTEALKATEEAKKLIEEGKRGPVAEAEILDKYKDKKSPPARANPVLISSTSSGTGAPLPSSGTGVPSPSGSPQKSNTNSKDSDALKTMSMKDYDANLIQHVLHRVNLLKDYPVQFSALKTEYTKIYGSLTSLVEGSVAIKNLADKLQKMTQTLLELKYIEPKIVGVSVKADTSIRLGPISWIVEQADKDFDKQQKLSLTAELQKMRKDDPLLNKMYEEHTGANKESVNKIFMEMLAESNDVSKVKNKLIRDMDKFTKINNVPTLEAIIALMKETLVNNNPDDQKKACRMLSALADVVGYGSSDKYDVLKKAMYYYDGSANPTDPKQSPCFNFLRDKKPEDKKPEDKNKKKPDGKNGKDYKGGRDGKSG
jgi:hypothetical protein